MNFRKATIEDAELLLVWRNDPETRAASRNMGIIKLEDHRVWLAGVIQNPRRYLFIAEVGKTPVGTIRADDGERGTELSWTVAPEARGQGHGKRMLAEFLRHSCLAGEEVWAEIKTDNPASVKMVAGLGFAFVGREGDLEKWVFHNRRP